MATESNEAAHLPPPSVKDLGEGDGDVEHVEKDIKTVVAAVTDRPVHEMYLEALERYPNDEAIDQAAEKRLLRKLDMRILPLLGICYFFYVSPFNVCILLWLDMKERLTWAQVRRQNYALIRRHLRHQKGPEPRGRRLLMAVEQLLLWLADLGHPVQPPHAAQPACLLPRLQHLHVGRAAHVPGRGEESAIPAGSSDSVWGVRGHCRPGLYAHHVDVLHAGGAAVADICVVCV